jgi:hypothetical protein
MVGEAKRRGTDAERVANAIARKNSITITYPLTGKPVEETPDGISPKDVTFQTRDEAWEFICEHWENPVEMREAF